METVAAVQEGGERNWLETPERKKPRGVYCSTHSTNTDPRGARSGGQVSKGLRESWGWRDRQAA